MYGLTFSSFASSQETNFNMLYGGNHICITYFTDRCDKKHCEIFHHSRIVQADFLPIEDKENVIIILDEEGYIRVVEVAYNTHTTIEDYDFRFNFQPIRFYISKGHLFLLNNDNKCLFCQIPPDISLESRFQFSEIQLR